MMLPSVTHIVIFLVLLTAFAIATVKTGKLSVPAAIAACITGIMVFLGNGYTGIILLGAFFLLGTLATAHDKRKKGTAGLHPQQRKAGQVFANGGVAALAAFLTVFMPQQAPLLLLLTAASLASATADTLSSELGIVYGRRFYNVLTFKPDTKGMDGVVSLEGTLLGAAGAAVIAGIYGLFTSFDKYCLLVILAGIAGNLADSVLGATLERKGWIGNDTVNFFNTAVAALLAWMLY